MTNNMKKVNIYPTTPIYSLNPVVRGVVCNVTKSVSDIRKCLIAKAKVEEILSDGTTIQLTLFNYDKNNTPEAASDKAEESVTSVINKIPEPVVEKEEVKVEEPEKEEKKTTTEDGVEAATEEDVKSDEVESSEKVEDAADDDKYGL